MPQEKHIPSDQATNSNSLTDWMKRSTNLIRAVAGLIGALMLFTGLWQTDAGAVITVLLTIVTGSGIWGTDPTGCG